MADDALRNPAENGDPAQRKRDAQAGPPLTWILLGFGLAYALFFLWPVFLAGSTMQSPQVVPSMTPIGADLSQTLVFAKYWLWIGTPFVQTATYPPLSYLLFIPLLSVEYSQRYVVFTALSLVAYGVATFAFPFGSGRGRRAWPVLVLILATGLVSYGFQFEIERGQFDLIAIALSFAAIWIYHFKSRATVLAFVLLTLAVQLKVYPVLFAVMLVKDWRDWKHNLAALGGFAAANLGLLFIFGMRIFLGFVQALREVGLRPDLIWIGNHSIHSFVNLGAQRAALRGVLLPAGATTYAEIGLVAIVCLCLGALIYRACRSRREGFNASLLLACTIAAMLIPSVSNDYKLSILGGALAVFLASPLPESGKGVRHFLLDLAVFGISLAYASTLFPPTYKPQSLVFQNNFPALFGMLLLVTGIGWWSGTTAASSADGGHPAQAAASA